MTSVNARRDVTHNSAAPIGRARAAGPIAAAVCPQWSRKLFPAILLLFSKILRLDFREDAVRANASGTLFPSDRCEKDAARMRLGARGCDEERFRRWVSREPPRRLDLASLATVAEVAGGEEREKTARDEGEYVREIEAGVREEVRGDERASE